MSPKNHDTQRPDDDSARQTALSAHRTFRSDASGEFEEGGNQNRLRDQHVAHISRTFHAYADVEKYARVVPLIEIAENGWNLNISLMWMRQRKKTALTLRMRYGLQGSLSANVPQPRRR